MVGLLGALTLCFTATHAESIPPLYRHVAETLDVPPDVLYAVALTESGATLQSGRHRPWPWTLNEAGQGRYYATRGAAHAALTAVLARGTRNVDVGLMQVNWHWNGERFVDAWDALNPSVNLTVGAIVLREGYEALGTWSAAIGRYHSAKAPRAARYVARVERARAQLAGARP